MIRIGTKKVRVYLNGKQLNMFFADDNVDVSGTFTFKKDITLPSENISLNIGFMSNSNIYKRMAITNALIFYCPNENMYGSTTVFNGSWNKDSYRTITFDGVQRVSRKFYAWLVANTVDDDVEVEVENATLAFLANFSLSALNGKLLGEFNSDTPVIPDEPDIPDIPDIPDEPEDPIISFTIVGASYQALGGMTWGEWVNSSYNTGEWQVDSYDGYIYRDSDGYIIQTTAFEDVHKNDNILANGVYYIRENMPPEEPDVPDVPDKTEIIQGEYKFNEVVTNDISVDENVPFTCGGKEYTGIIITSTDIYYKTSVGSEWVATLTDGKLTFFQDVFRTVNFSTAVVSVTLYNWVQANTYIPYYVRGTWYFDEDLGTIQGTEFPDISVNFTSNGEQFSVIHCAVGIICYNNSGSPIIPYAYDTKDGWIDEAYRTITFDGVQYVSKEFYNWLTKNAEATIARTYLVSGTWKFNEAPSFTLSTDYAEYVDFISNGVNFEELLVTHRGYYIRCMPTNGEKGDEIYIYDNDTGWLNDAYRTIAFVGIQYVSHAFYDWFVANAVRQTITFTIDGTSYTAYSGMTWEEWIDSEYNTGGFWNNCDTSVAPPRDNDGIGVPTQGSADYVAYNGGCVEPADVIQPLAYEIKYGGSN